MKTTLQSIAVAVAVVLGGVVAGSAEAHGPNGHGSMGGYHSGHGSGHSYHNYHLSNGYRFSHGYYFRGSNYSHFSYRYWNSRYGCYFYYYPGTSCYYYWSGSNSCYYPTSYASVVAPNGPPPAGITNVPLQSPPVTQQVNVSNVQNQGPGIPPVSVGQKQLVAPPMQQVP